MLTGDNSILGRAQSTHAYNSIGKAKDEVNLVYNSAMTEYLRLKYDDGATPKTIDELFGQEITNLNTKMQAQNTSTGTTTITYSNKVVTITYKDLQSGKTYTTTATLNDTLGSEKLGTWTAITEKDGKVDVGNDKIKLTVVSEVETESRAAVIKIAVDGANESDVKQWLETLTSTELNNMVAQKESGQNWEDSWLNEDYNDLQEAFEDGYPWNDQTYTDKYEMMIKAGYVDYTNYPKAITLTLNSESIKIGLAGEFVVTKNDDYEITATNEAGDTGHATAKVTKCTKNGMEEKFQYPTDKTQNYPLIQDGGYEAIIPEGFAYGKSANVGTISKGLVITDAIDEAGNSIGNEFVWIPMEKGTLKVKGTNKPMAIETTGTDTKGNKNYQGALYDTWTENATYNTNYVQTNPSNYREPAYLTDSNYADNSNYNKDASGNKIVTETSLQESYNEMVKSVIANGGFYVARYEMGKEENYSKLNVMPTSASAEDENMWYGLYSKAKAYAQAADNTKKVTSYMIWGSQYDAMLNFGLTNSADSSKVIASNNGNHSNSLLKTGTYQGTDSINNIFDLEGNQLEWTQEAYGTDYRAIRGGRYSRSGSPPSLRDTDLPNTLSRYYSSRLSLYVK